MTPVMSSSAAGAASDTTAGGASEIATCWAAWRLRLRRTRDTWRYHKQIWIVYMLYMSDMQYVIYIYIRNIHVLLRRKLETGTLPAQFSEV